MSEDQRQPRGLSKFRDGAATVLDSWRECVSIDDHQDLLMMARRIGKLVDDGLRGSDVILSWFTRRIQPLSFQPKLICRFSGMDDALCITKQTLPADSLGRRARQLWKVAKDASDLEIAVDIYTADNVCPRVSKFTFHFTCAFVNLHSF